MKEESNCAEFYENIWITCALLLLECNSDENIAFQIDFIRDVQELATSNSHNIRLSLANRISLHGLCICHLAMLGFVVKSVDLMEYKDRLVSVRRSLAPHLLPPLSDDYPPDLEPNLDLDEILIDLEVARSALRKEGRFVDKIGGGGQGGGSGLSSHRNSRQNSPRHSPRNSWMEGGGTFAQRRPSSVSVNSVSVEVDSCASSPGIFR